MLRSVVAGALLFTVAPAAAADAGPVTFTRDVAPILQKSCQGCHRPGEAAPMSFLTYQQVRPWAKAIKEAVLLRKMPPWFADPHYGKFRNDRALSQRDMNTLVSWVNAGAPEGDPRHLPPAAEFVDGWNIGKPDLEIAMANDFHVPASGTIEYQYIVMPTRFTEDKWVQMAEVRPGNRALLHHVIAFVREPGSKWLRGAKPNEAFVPPPGSRDREEGSGQFLVGYAPGSMPEVLEPGRAKLIQAGSDIVFQLHYTTNGQPGADRTKVGLIFAKEPPKERVLTVAAMNRKFAIPPGAANHEVHAEVEFASDVKLLAMLPHMHLRGKDFEYRAVYPTGETQTILRVPRYDFNWQLSYYPERELLLPKGSRIACTAHFDNSPNNPNNPDPGQEVRWGDQSWEEMMIGFMDIAVDVNMDLKKIFPERKKRRGD
jgi:hypothetical protein